MREQDEELARLRSLVFTLNSKNSILESKLDGLVQINESLSSELAQLRRAASSIDASSVLEQKNRKIRKEKKRNRELVDALKTLKLENEESAAALATKEEEAQMLRMQISELESRECTIQVSDLNVSEAKTDVSGLVGVIRQQADEIQELYKQRNALVCELQAVERVIGRFQGGDVKEEECELDYELLPVELRRKLVGLPVNDVIKGLVERIRACEEKKVEHVVVDVNGSGEETEGVQKQNCALRACLHEVYTFIERLATATRNGDERSELLMKCARIGQFMDMNGIGVARVDVAKAFDDASELTSDDLREIVRYLVNVSVLLMKREEHVPVEPDVNKRKEEVQDESIEGNRQRKAVPSPVEKRQRREISRLVEENDMLRAHARKIKRKFVKERDAFCRLANKLANDIERKVVSQTKHYERQIDNISARLEKACKRLHDAKADAREAEDRHSKEMLEKDVLITQLNQTIALNRVSLENQRLKLQVQEVDFDEERQEFADHFARVIEKKNSYKQRLVDNLLSGEALTEVKEKARQDQESIIMKYETCIKHLQSDRDNLKGLCQKVQDKLAQCMIERQELTNDKCQALARIRSLQIELAEALKCREREKLQYEGKLKGAEMSQETKWEAKLGKENEKIQYLESVLRKISHFFGITKCRTAADLCDLVLAELQKQREGADWIQQALDLRDELRSQEVTLKDYISSMKQQNERLEEVIKAKESEIAKLKDSIRGTSESDSYCEQWSRWCESLLARVRGPTFGTPSIEKLRKDMEDIVVSTLKQGLLNRQLSILRGEKQLILKHGNLANLHNHPTTITSVRPVILSIVCVRRLLKMAGACPLSLYAT